MEMSEEYYLEFNNTIFSLEHIKYVQYRYKDGNVLYNKLLTITYWDNDTIEFEGIAGYNRDELDRVYEKIKNILLSYYDYEEGGE